MKYTEELGKILNHYGNLQIVQAIQELNELAVILNRTYIYEKTTGKDWFDGIDMDSVVEEIADVEIMLAQVKVYFDIVKEEIDKVKEVKIKRTLERIKEVEEC